MIKLNGKEIDFGQFPNGEICVKRLDLRRLIHRDEANQIFFKYENDGDFFKLGLIKNMLDEWECKPILTIAYMPYSRQDRLESGNAFTLKYVSQLINDMKFSLVFVNEPHSDVTPALLNNVRIELLTTKIFNKHYAEIGKMGFNPYIDAVCFPDAGAQKRYKKAFNYRYQLVGMKERDSITGQVKDLTIYGDCQAKNVVIIDDLCSYGGTFVAAAKALKDKGANQVYLVVAHCEKSILKGNIPNCGLIDKVFTTNSIIDAGIYVDYEGKDLIIVDEIEEYV